MRSNQPASTAGVGEGQSWAFLGCNVNTMEQTGFALWLFLHVEMESTFLEAQEIQGYGGAVVPWEAAVLLTHSQEVDFFLGNNGWGEGAGGKRSHCPQPLSPS